MTAQLVPIVVTDEIGQPDGANTPTGVIMFQLTEEITGPQGCSALTVGSTYQGGAIAQQLVANDLDSDGDPITPATTMYGCRQAMDGAAPQGFFVTVPAVPPDSRTVTDAVVELGRTTLTSATADFTDADEGAYVLVENGSVVPPGTTITKVIDGTTITLSQAALGDASGQSLMIGASVALGTLRPPQ